MAILLARIFIFYFLTKIPFSTFIQLIHNNLKRHSNHSAIEGERLIYGLDAIQTTTKIQLLDLGLDPNPNTQT